MLGLEGAGKASFCSADAKFDSEAGRAPASEDVDDGGLGIGFGV